jgi:SAM-dependent methyltransferase
MARTIERMRFEDVGPEVRPSRPAFPWDEPLAQLASSTWRTPVLREMVLRDIRSLGGDGTVLDIGCGRGFDDHPDSQRIIAAHCRRMVGVEPDACVAVPECFDEVHATTFEGAALLPESVDVAYAVMVLEHVEDPGAFWRKLAYVLKPGGVFWGFTVNGAHWFAPISLAMGRAGLKSFYLDLVHGARGSSRFIDYPVRYRCNTDAEVARHASGFSGFEIKSFGEIGGASFYFPRVLRPAVRMFDSRWHSRTGQRISLAVRAVK